MDIGKTRIAGPIKAKGRSAGSKIDAFGYPTQEQLNRALLVSARLIKRYKGTDFENTSMDLFERMEREVSKAEQRNAVSQRAEAILNAGTVKKNPGLEFFKQLFKHSDKQTSLLI